MMKYPEKIFHATSAAVLIFDADGAMIWMNRAGSECTGRQFEELSGLSIYSFFSDTSREKIVNVIRQGLSGDAPASFDLPIRLKDQSFKRYRWNLLILEGEEEPPQKKIVFCGSELEADASVSADKDSMFERYKLLFENAGIGIMYIDKDSNITLVNKEFEKLLGYAKAEAEGQMKWMQLVAFEKDLQRMKEYHLLRSIDPSRAPDAYNAKLRHRNGDVLDVIVRVTMIPQSTDRMVSFLDMTQERKSQKKIRESEVRYRSLVDNIQDGLYRSDLKGKLVFCNPSAAHLIGYDQPEDIIGSYITRNIFYNPAKRREFLKHLNMEGKVANYEVVLRHKDGSPVTVSTSSHYYYDVQGKVMGVEGLFTDITYRKETEKALKENKERLEAITENMPGVVYQFYATDGGEYGISYVNFRLMNIFGLPREDVGSFPAFLTRVYPEDRDRLLDTIRKAVETASSWNFEGRFIKPSGEMMWFHGLSTPTRLEDRLVFNGVLLDITEKKKAEETSRQTEEKFYKVFATTPDCIVITRMDDEIITEVNRGFEEMIGWKREEVLGRPSSEMRLWLDPDERDRMMRELRSGLDVLNREATLRRKDGTPVYGLYSARTLHIAGEKSLVFVLHDITEKRRLEDERRKLEEQLYQSQKMDAIGQLASGVAHDFNNILSGISGNVSLIKMEYDADHPHYRRLNRIEENVKRGANLTKQLLGFARGGKYEIKTLDINELIRKNVHLFTETRKEIGADFCLQNGAYWVDADAGQLDQMFLNIYINAGHAMQGGGNLHLETVNVTLSEKEASAFETAPGNYVRISVSDTGTGMDAATLKRIFEPFFTTKAGQGGSGLGLASAYGIVRNHGGAITVESQPGCGTTFRIYLPASLRPMEEKKQKEAERLVSGSGVILLVDDEPMILDSAAEMLKMLGYTVYAASTGQAAVSIYMEKQQKIDLVILDMILPGMNGAQVLRLLKEVNPAVHVILSSGYSMEGDARDVMNLGCDGFLQKPYSFSDLSALVSKAIHASRKSAG